MKLGKFSLAIGAALVALNATATVYNTGYSTSVNGGGQLVDNLWTVTNLVSPPGGTTFPAVPYPAFVLPPGQTPTAWDYTAPPVGAPNHEGTTQWDSNHEPAFGGSDTAGMITTYTLNFNGAGLFGNRNIYFESDNYVQMYLGAVSPGNLFYTEPSSSTPAPGDPNDFQSWHNTLIPIAGLSGLQQLNIVVFNQPWPSGNYTGLRVNFGVAVPEPSSLALVAGGLAALLAAVKRRK